MLNIAKKFAHKKVLRHKLRDMSQLEIIYMHKSVLKV